MKVSQYKHNIYKIHFLPHQVEQMLQKYDWIASERSFFGQPNSAFDFAANDMKDVSRRLSKLQETKDKLGKNVNMRAMNMLGKAEEKVVILQGNI